MLSDLSVLCVDDDMEFAEVLARRFRRRGARVRVCGSAEACLQEARNDPPHVVITDRMLGRHDGLGLIAQLREVLPSIVVIMLSGCFDEASIREAMRAGVTEYLAKPVPLIELEKVLLRYSVAVATAS